MTGTPRADAKNPFAEPWVYDRNFHGSPVGALRNWLWWATRDRIADTDLLAMTLAEVAAHGLPLDRARVEQEIAAHGIRYGRDGSAPRAASPAVVSERGLVIESVLDLMADADKPLVWAWDGAILLGSLTQALGRWESFKSMALQNLLAATYHGDPFLDRATLQMPVVYISNEKTRQTIGKRFAAMLGKRPIDPERFLVLHRKGVQIGGRFWDEVVEAVARIAGPKLVALDTLASLAKPGFRENTSEDMGAALSGIRLLTSECQATTILAHHPAKSGGGVGRGHGSLDGEVDGTLAFIRPDRREDTGQLEIRPKDGEFRAVEFAWDPITYLFRDAGPLAARPESVAALVTRRWDEDGETTSSKHVEDYFTGVSPRTVRRHLDRAVTDGLIEVVSGGVGGLATVYRGPVGGLITGAP